MIAHRNAAAFVTSLPTVYTADAAGPRLPGLLGRIRCLRRGDLGGVRDRRHAGGGAGARWRARHSTWPSSSPPAGSRYFSTVPSFLALIDRDLPTVRLLVLGGEVCMQELVTRWAKGGRRLLNTYGPTEATVVATWTECTAGEPITIGRALPGYHDPCPQRATPARSALARRASSSSAATGRAGLSQPAGADGGAVHREPVRGARDQALPHPRPRPPWAGWCAPVPGQDRRPGEDPRIPCRAVRDRGGADAVSRHQGRGRAHGVGRRSAGAGSLRGARRSGYAARPGGCGGDAARPSFPTT